MICPSCNKFAAYDTSTEPEVEVEIEEGVITGSARIVLMSECCGEELKEANFEIDLDLSDDLISAIRKALSLDEKADVDLEEWALAVEATSAEITERNETEITKTKKDGTVVRKPIPYRYQKRFFGVSITFNASATKGDITVDAEGSFDDEVQASAMDELV